MANIVNLSKYAGNDEVISSYEMAKILKKQKGIFKVNSQIPILDRYLEGFALGELITISGLTKNGKCHGEGTKILMFDGTIKNVEDIVIGDNLMGDDSTPRHVISTTVGEGKLFEISAKGSIPFTCNEEHILCLVRTRTAKTKRGKPYLNFFDNKIIEIPLSEYLKSSNFKKHILKSYKVPVDFPYKKVNIDPYLLGVWLGDGSSHGPEITTADQEIVDYINGYASRERFYVTIKDQPNNKSKIYRICDDQNGRKGSVLRNRFKELLKEYNLLKNKHIPHIYKINSKAIRMKMLAGLIDTDGNTVPSGTLGNAIEIIQKNQRLANDIVFLARSLGFATTIHKVIKKIKKINFEGEYYRIRLNGDTGKIPCLLKRKLFKAYTCKKKVLRSAFTVKAIGSGKYYGFTLDGNGRYLLSDFQVTHNTLMSQSLTKNFLQQQMCSLWFTYELPPRQFLSCFPDLPLLYMPKQLKAADMHWIEDRIIESKKKYNTRIVFIDHLHYLFDMAKAKNHSIEIGVVVRRLKSLAVRENLIIFLMCHTTKIAPDTKEVGFEFMRDSSIIAQESDVVLMIRRKPKIGANITEVSVELSRRTGIMKKKVWLEKVGAYLVETTDRTENEISKKHWEVKL